MGAGLRQDSERQKVRDKFVIEDNGPGRIHVNYDSPMQLCKLYMMLVNEVALHFGDTVNIKSVECKKRGDQGCRFSVVWPDPSILPKAEATIIQAIK